MTKLRLYAGTINARPDEDGWRNFTLDIEPRGVWDRDLNMAVLPDFVGDVSNLVDFRDDMWDEVVLHHVLEHLPLEHAIRALVAIHRVLKPGGTLDIEVPDMDAIAARWLAAREERPGLQQWIYGEQLSYHAPGDSHRFGWDELALRAELTNAGFDVGAREAEGLALRFVATKGVS